MIIYFIICFVIIFLTRILAYWGINTLQFNEIPLIKDILHLTYVENRGAAFGIFQNNKLFLSATSIILFLVISIYIFKNYKTMSKDLLFALSFVAAGGISNVIDRLSFSYVVDYINFTLINYPVFNLADICVVLGTIYIGFKILTTKEEGK